MEDVWVLLYLIDSDAWWPEGAPHYPNYFPDVHTHCFSSKDLAEAHRQTMSNPDYYKVRRTQLKG